MKTTNRLFLIIITFALAACGGGGGGGGGTDSVPATPKTTAVLKIGTQGAPSAAVIGVGLTITLPVGVTVEVDSNGNVPLSSANVSGVAQSWGFVSTYNAASNPISNSTLTLLASANGNVYQAGEMFTVNCKLPVGNTLSESDFQTAIITTFNPSDASLNRVNGLNPTLAATLK